MRSTQSRTDSRAQSITPQAGEDMRIQSSSGSSQVGGTDGNRDARSSYQGHAHDGDIAKRAYELYMSRGCEDGHDVEDWVEAEREVLAEENGTVRFPE
jgi:hypothetical protein